ncbi:nucleoside hydrolase [Pseudoneobacillus rhizosphaerae]|uniref:Pyrimidine-specific ribonucleoside hydrolase RihA n=1 Tax=Pseudoneobacillus rhizosphaerae TaxID=2880968 RepID=A0A9C7GCH1_9BACI|nr:nucleoside hydrolase [Pseudoneobacillus rhizosphaerae]CAG9609866.1 Pyrimidine-specific ribonucleoside hydrolase RihA [Pseudoneobacillus rhizosphaerae]
MYNILMFVDSGVDDSLALMYALLNPKLNVVGVVSGYGNISKEQSLHNTAYLLKLAGREDIPIIAGVAGPLSGELTRYYPDIHGEKGLGPIQPPADFEGLKVYDIDKIIEIVNQYKNNLIIVGVGRQTDLALPFIVYGANALKDVVAFYIMGGAFLVPGNVTAEAEANFFADPIAADLVIEKGHNVFIHPLNITNSALIKPEDIDFLAKNSQSPFKNLIKPAFDYYFDAYKELVPGIQGAPIHDVVPLFALTNPGAVQYLPKQVRIEQFGQSRGKSMADFRPNPEEVAENKKDWIGMKIDLNRFREDFIRTFQGR